MLSIDAASAREGITFCAVFVAFGQAEVRQVQVRADLADAKRLVTEIEARPKISPRRPCEDKVRQQEAEDEAAEKAQWCFIVAEARQERLEKKRLAEKRRWSQIETCFIGAHALKAVDAQSVPSRGTNSSCGERSQRHDARGSL